MLLKNLKIWAQDGVLKNPKTLFCVCDFPTRDVIGAGAGSAARIERLIEELDDTSRKVDQARQDLPSSQLGAS